MARLILTLFGRLAASLDGTLITTFESAKVRALLAYLAAEADRPQRREALAEFLWPDWPQQSAMRNLRNALADLRKNIGDQEAPSPFLLITRETIQLNHQADVWVDVVKFEEAAGEQGLGSSEQRSGISDQQSTISVDLFRHDLQSAIALYRGPFLEDFSLPDSPAFEQWVLARREGLHRQALQILFTLAETHELQGNLETALLYAQRQVALESWHEPAQQQLMRLQALAGQRSAALAQYEACRKALADELNVEPSAETRRLYEAIRDEDIEVIRGQGIREKPLPPIPYSLPPSPGDPPFMGMQYFDTPDAGLFFGREALTARLVGHIREMVAAGVDNPEGCCFLAVVGASGSGKSSVVRAGVVPALQSGEPLADGSLPLEGSPSWHIHVFTPTAHPLEALAVSLTREIESVTAATTLVDDMSRESRSLNMYARRLLAPQSPGLAGKCRLLLAVDQFEELFTLCRSETERTAFLDNLLTAVQGGGPTQVIVVLRADFYGHCAQYPLLRQALCSRQEYIGPMEASELRRAIEEPAQRNGWEFEPGLVELILRDIGVSEDHPPEPGALPLLEHALLETWQRRSGRTLSLKGYADAGGVHGAIAKTAESVFAKLTPEQQALARRIFLRLTELGEGTQDTRRRAPLDELALTSENTPGVINLLKILADARLITLAEGTAEVAHEALIREWPALRQWLSEDREGLRLHRHLTDSAESWAALEHDAGELLRGVRLAQALEWAQGHPDDLNTLEREYLQISQEQADREMTEREAQRQRELQAAKRLARTQRQRSLVLAAGLLIAIALGLLSFGFYRQSNQNLETARAANTQVAAIAVTAQAANTQAVAIAATAKADANIAIGRQALAQAQVLPKDSDEALVQSGLLIIEGLRRAPGIMANELAQQILGRFARPIARMKHESIVNVVAFSPDGRWVVSGSWDGMVKVWAADSGDEVAHMEHKGFVTAVAFSPDGRWVVSGSYDGMARVWWADSGVEVAHMTHEGAVAAVAFSPDGRWVVSGSYDGTARVWWAKSGVEISRQEYKGRVDAVAFSPDGGWVVSGCADGTVQVWQAGTGKEVAQMTHSTRISSTYTEVTMVAFGSSRRWVASARGDGTVRIWDAVQGIEVTNIDHNMPITALDFSPDGRWIVSGGADGTARVWEATTGKEIARMVHGGGVTAAVFSPDGRWVVSGSRDGTARVWGADNGVEIARLQHEFFVTAVAFSPHGNRIATGSYDHTVRVWEVEAGNTIASAVHRKRVNVVAFSPDGQRVVSGSDDNTAQVWDAASGVVTARMIYSGSVNAAVFSPDGRRVVTGSYDGTARVCQADTGAEIAHKTYAGAVNAVAFSPDGQWVVTASEDGTAQVWWADSGAKIAQMKHDRAVNAVAFSPDGQWVVSGSVDGMARVWRADNGVEITRRTHTGAVNAVAFSPDGLWVVSGGYDGTVRVWEAASEFTITSMTHKSAVNAVAFSPDGHWVVSGSNDGTAQVWQANTGVEIARKTHAGAVNAVAFSPDGVWVVSGSDDGAVRVWQAANGSEAARLTSGGAVNAVAFSPDGRWILTGSNDQTARVWAWQSQDAIILLCARLPRNFTQDEWKQFFGDVQYHQTCANLP